MLNKTLITTKKLSTRDQIEPSGTITFVKIEHGTIEFILKGVVRTENKKFSYEVVTNTDKSFLTDKEIDGFSIKLSNALVDWLIDYESLF